MEAQINKTYKTAIAEKAQFLLHCIISAMVVLLHN
jgi:hypothetical protein